jgi:hypothetical protein
MDAPACRAFNLRRLEGRLQPYMRTLVPSQVGASIPLVSEQMLTSLDTHRTAATGRPESFDSPERGWASTLESL